jgi:hypothetical protein
MDTQDSITQMIGELSDLKSQINDKLQHVIFDGVGYTKLTELEKKIQGRFENISCIFFGNDLKNARPKKAIDCRYEQLPEDYFLGEMTKPPADSVFIFTNNDVGKGLQNYIEFRASNPQALFVVWDWDGSHWTYMSSILALHSDFFVSGCSENTFFLSHFTPNLLGPIFGGANQWTREFVLKHIDLALTDRSDDPLGVHYFYGQYPRRNRAIATVSKSFSTVRFGDNAYKKRSDLDNFIEWCSYKTHWIMPVLGGLPIRGYNALITGGIPILPSFLKNFPEVEALKDIPLYYEISDLIDPSKIQSDAITKFNDLGLQGVMQRIIDGLNIHHIDSRCTRIVELIDMEIRRIKACDRSYSAGYYKV